MANRALIIVDVQNDFMKGGSLAVKDAEDILENINSLGYTFDVVVATQDYHPSNHSSFASVAGVAPFTQVNGDWKWPDHCVAGTWGAEFHKDLNVKYFTHIVQKGRDVETESYSGVKDAKNKYSNLYSYLIEMDIDEVYVCGLALDYCVEATAKDLADCGFYTYIVADATKPVDPDHVYNLENVTLTSTFMVLNQ